jgi:predicted DNA-binding protein (MmcQ/YjbR family)
MATRAKKTGLLARVRRVCARLPDTEESSRLGGEPHFYVRGKIFAGCGGEGDDAAVGMKVGLEMQAILVTRPGIHVAKYVGKHGWITVEERALADDAELERLIRRSYDLITGAADGEAPARHARQPATKATRKAAKKAATKRVKAPERGTTRVASRRGTRG